MLFLKKAALSKESPLQRIEWRRDLPISYRGGTTGPDERADTERPSIWYRLSRDWYRLYRDAAVHSLKILLIRRWVDVRPNWKERPSMPTLNSVGQSQSGGEL